MIYFGTTDTILFSFEFGMYFGAIYVATKMLLSRCCESCFVIG